MLAPLVAAAASAQEPRPRGTCEVSLGRGARQPGGSAGTMVVAGGRACGSTLFVRPESNEPTSAVALATPPAHGRVTLTQPNRFDYTPAPGYAGEDRFVITGTPAPFRITVTVTVLPARR